MLFKKIDKNNNGKIEKEEITEADIEFCKELLKESIKTIALGMYKQSGMTSKQVNTMMLKEIKNSKNLIEETIKKEKEKENNENQKNSEKIDKPKKKNKQKKIQNRRHKILKIIHKKSGVVHKKSGVVHKEKQT